MEADVALTVGRIVGSVYDKQGFLLKLDGKLPAELVYKYGNLSEGVHEASSHVSRPELQASGQSQQLLTSIWIQNTSLSCKRCIIVGNGGILANKSLGSRIDDYDIVDVGTKTTMRITYPEGAIQRPERYEKDSLFIFSAFKPLDFKWLRQMVFREKLVRRTSSLTYVTIIRWDH
ncbi:unnamed protein product, partial [Coregonus sp. 'balchen']